MDPETMLSVIAVTPCRASTDLSMHVVLLVLRSVYQEHSNADMDPLDQHHVANIAASHASHASHASE